MKQYDVEMSAMAGFGYTDCSEFITSVNLRVVLSSGLGGDCLGPFDGSGGSTDFYRPWLLVLVPQINKWIRGLQSSDYQ